MYKLIYSHQFFKQIRKLDKNAKKRIISTLERIRIRPYPHVRRLVGSPYFRLRAGDYRIILDIKGDKLIIYVLEVGHRRSIYK